MAKSQAKPTSPASKIVRKPKTVLDSGITYSLCSRVFNALPVDKKLFLRADSKSKHVTMVDGRGSEHGVHPIIVKAAEQLGAKFLVSIRTSYLRPRMEINWKTGDVTMNEVEKVEEKAEAATAKTA